MLANVRRRARRSWRRSWREKVAPHPGVGEVRQRGLMVGVELARPGPGLRWGRRVCAGAVRRGVLLRPLGDVVVVMPPLTVTAGGDRPDRRRPGAALVDRGDCGGRPRRRRPVGAPRAARRRDGRLRERLGRPRRAALARWPTAAGGARRGRSTPPARRARARATGPGRWWRSPPTTTSASAPTRPWWPPPTGPSTGGAPARGPRAWSPARARSTRSSRRPLAGWKGTEARRGLPHRVRRQPRRAGGARAPPGPGSSPTS